MLNYIWIGLVVVSVIVGAATGNLKAVADAAVEYAGIAVRIAIGLIGIMAFWLGMMKIAQEAGFIRFLARLIRPLSKRLFPGIPKDHPAIGAMVMNVAANWLGLSNAATPLGLKAMEELQKLNPSKNTATNAMVLFLGLNTASITLIPMTMIAIRAEAGSANPFEIIGPALIASTCATITAVLMAKLLQRLPVFKKTDPTRTAQDKEASHA